MRTSLTLGSIAYTADAVAAACWLATIADPSPNSSATHATKRWSMSMSCVLDSPHASLHHAHDDPTCRAITTSATHSAPSLAHGVADFLQQQEQVIGSGRRGDEVEPLVKCACLIVLRMN